MNGLTNPQTHHHWNSFFIDCGRLLSAQRQHLLRFWSIRWFALLFLKSMYAVEKQFNLVLAHGWRESVVLRIINYCPILLGLIFIIIIPIEFDSDLDAAIWPDEWYLKQRSETTSVTCKYAHEHRGWFNIGSVTTNYCSFLCRIPLLASLAHAKSIAWVHYSKKLRNCKLLTSVKLCVIKMSSHKTATTCIINAKDVRDVPDMLVNWNVITMYVAFRCEPISYPFLFGRLSRSMSIKNLKLSNTLYTFTVAGDT